MTQEQLNREINYYIVLSLAKQMLKTGVIDESDFLFIDKSLMSKYHPIVEGLYPEMT